MNEQELREQIAKEIEAEYQTHPVYGAKHYEDWNDAIGTAAAIARGQK